MNFQNLVLILKFIFQCSNGGCLIELAQQLAVIMVGKQIINNAQEILIPKMKAWWHNKKVTFRINLFSMFSCIVESSPEITNCKLRVTIYYWSNHPQLLLCISLLQIFQNKLMYLSKCLYLKLLFQTCWTFWIFSFCTIDFQCIQSCYFETKLALNLKSFFA